MSDVATIIKQAKADGIRYADLLAAKRECEAVHEENQQWIDRIRRATFTAVTGRTDQFWLIFGHPSCRLSQKIFHHDGDYSSVSRWDEVAQSVWYETQFCRNEEDAEAELFDFIRNQTFKIPTNAELYREAYRRLRDSRDSSETGE